MTIFIGDLEADGLLQEASRVWCGAFLSYPDEKEYTFDNKSVDNIPSFLSGNVVVFHNGSGYDMPLLNKIYGAEKCKNIVMLDSLKMSQMMFPDIKGHSKPHSIEAWGNRFGIKKPEHEDWSRYTPEMLHRCVEDVKIGYKLIEYIVDTKWPTFEQDVEEIVDVI